MDDRWSANVLTQELEVDADALVDALKAGIRDKPATVQVRSAQAWSQLIYGRQLQGRADEGDPSISRP